MKMKYKEELKLFIRVLFSPSCWIRNTRCCPIWDYQLRKELQNPVFTDADRYTIKLNGVCLWSGNFPYASYSLHPPIGYESLPSRRTVFLIHDAIARHNCEGFDK